MIQMQFCKLIHERFLFILSICLIILSTIGCSQHFTTTKSDQGIEIMENGKKVLYYQVQPKSVDGKYERAGYIHPLYSLNEKILYRILVHNSEMRNEDIEKLYQQYIHKLSDEYLLKTLIIN
jgi:hypothetical protein